MMGTERFLPEERAAIHKFYRILARRCNSVPDGENCPGCDMRLFCYMAPPSKDAPLIDKAIDFLESFEMDD